MGIAHAGTIIRSGSPLAIQGAAPSGIAVNGKVIYRAEPWQLLAHNIVVANSSGGMTLNTIGADLLVIVGILGNATQIPIISDVPSNTWISGPRAVSSAVASEIRYCIAPNTSASHQFNFAGVNYSAYSVLAFALGQNLAAGTSSIASTNINSPLSLQLSPFTVSDFNTLLISGVSTSAGNAVAIDSDFQIVDKNLRQTVYIGGASASGISSPQTLSPTWTLDASWANYPGAATALQAFVPSQWQLLDGLVDFWPMNEGSGTTFNNFVNPSNAMTAQNITWEGMIAGIPGYTPLFNGTTSEATSIQNSTLDGPFSVCFAVVYQNPTTVQPPLIRSIGVNAGWQITAVSGRIASYIISQLSPTMLYISTGPPDNSILPNQAFYICWTYDGSGAATGVNVYSNGVLTARIIYSNTLSGSFLSGSPTFLGWAGGAGGVGLAGTLANVRIYNRVLSASEVAALSATMGR